MSLKEISCPIIFLSPSNDFHGRIGDLPASVKEIASADWRVTCSPHHNHQDTPEYEVATQLWMDQHLLGKFQLPQTPVTKLTLKTENRVPRFAVTPDSSRTVLAVDVFYTQHGKPKEGRADIFSARTRFWHHAKAAETDGVWAADLPLENTDRPLWVYANVVYPLDKPVTGAGYYYGIYTAKTFNLSSVLTTALPEALRKASVLPTLKPSTLIEDFLYE